jgi:hypothetical protein
MQTLHPAGNGHGFTSRSQYLGRPLTAANVPRELPRRPRHSRATGLLVLAAQLVFIVAVVLLLFVGFILFGQQGHMEPEELAAPSPPHAYQWGNEQGAGI